jgi:carboxypeptidase Taq
MNAYEKLEAHCRKISDLGHISAIVNWDESAMMPAGGGAARSRATATLNVITHDLEVAPEIGVLLAECAELELSAWQQANVRIIQRNFDRGNCLSSEFVREQTEAVMASEQAWRVSRAKNDWQTMMPHLKRVVSLTRKEAALRASKTGLGLYDAMLDLYEPGMRAERLDELFAPLKLELPGLVTAIIERQSKTPLLPLGNQFETTAQRKLGLTIMNAMGFDFEHGRLDTSHHPFCGGVPEDVRLTTRYNSNDFLQSLFAVIHETGHAMYEQGRPIAWRSQPVSEALSMGTHESQSLLMEMQACRSLNFVEFAAPIMAESFGHSANEPAWSTDNLYRHVTQVKRGYIRVDADEATYPLHVILRYELEKALLEGSLEVDDLPAAWDEKMTTYLGISTVGNFENGVLQDVHWPSGLIGYFPTYTLGAMMAAQLFAAARVAIPEIPAQIGRGQFTELVAWLRQHVHHLGSSVSVDEVLVNATGQALTTEPFLAHLRSRYLAE